NDAVLIKRILDLGARSLLVPFVQNAEEARRAVAATRYPPAGIRGVAAVHRASLYGAVADYLQCSGPELTVIVQIETGESFAHLTEIASVDGVDAVFIGPGDLSASMGHLGNVLHPDVQALVRAAPAVCHRLGRKVGILAGTAEIAKVYAGHGYDFVAIGTDLGAMNATVKSHLHAFGRAPAGPGAPLGSGY
ncbi:MAG: HpcH/HpaI aldolase family protein, partial [Candidatus Saccharimonadales bacterium]